MKKKLAVIFPQEYIIEPIFFQVFFKITENKGNLAYFTIFFAGSFFFPKFFTITIMAAIMYK